MPQKKNQINGFWLFAQSNKARWKAQGLQIGSNQQLLAIANPIWKAMSPEEKKMWDAQAKEERKQNKQERGEYERLDNVGDIISKRRDPMEEARKRREKEIAETVSSWHGKDLTEEKFYLINFQDLCEVTQEDLERRQWLPREMAMVEYCLGKGIINTFHQFIWPGCIPLGFRRQAEQTSSEFHKIPTEEIEQDSHDYKAIFKSALQFVSASVREGRYPPLYCLTTQYEKTKCLCDWLWANSGDNLSMSNPLGQVHSLDDLAHQLLAHSGNPDTQNIARFQIINNLEGSQWDYISSTSCELHKELDISRYCALAVVRKFSYTMSDMIASHYGVELTEHHVPVREESSTPTVRAMPTSRFSSLSSTGGGRGRGMRRPPSHQASGGGGRAVGGGTTYTQLARPLTGREFDDSDEEQSHFPNSQRSAWQQQSHAAPPAGAGRGGAPRVADEARGAMSEQFMDWSMKGVRPGRAAVATDQDDSDFSSSQMADVDDAFPPVVGRGRGTTLGGGLAATTVPVPPGFGSMNPVGGRGVTLEGAPVRPGVPVGRGSMPAAPGSANQGRVVGRGVPVGRGTLPGTVPQGPSFGRGMMPGAGRGAVPGYGEMRRSEAGASGPVGRGYMPIPNASQTPSVGSQQVPVPAWQLDRGASSGQHDGGLPQAVPSLSGTRVRDTGLDTDSDNFEPSLQQDADFPSLESSRGRGVGGAGMARGVTIGRGAMPYRGRGFMPNK